MIRITDFNNLLSEMVADLLGISGFVLVANEKHLVKRLGDNVGIWLGVTIPSADPANIDEDNVGENNIVWIFILEKVDPGSLTTDEELEHYQKIQDVVTGIKSWLHARKMEGNEFLEYLNLDSMHTDPEYQFGGWNGWSISFNFDTAGY